MNNSIRFTAMVLSLAVPFVVTDSRAFGQDTECDPVEGCDVSGPEFEEVDWAQSQEWSRGAHVSERDGEIDVSTAAHTGLSFLYVRAAEGTREDSMFVSTYAAANERLFRGAYQDFDNGTDPTSQAQTLLSLIGELAPGDLAPALNATDASVSDIATWVAVVTRELGTQPIVRTSAETRATLVAMGVSAMFWQGEGDDRAARAQWALHAEYVSDPGEAAPFVHYSSSGRIPGIRSATVTLDLFRGSEAALAEIAGGYPGMDGFDALPEGAGGGGGRLQYVFPLTRDRGVIARKALHHSICGRAVSFACTPNRTSPHRGTDLAAPIGTGVRAAAAGTILNVRGNVPPRTCQGRRSGRVAGNFIQLRHRDGSTTRYLHLSAIASGIVRDQPIACGAPMGLTGISGNAACSGAVAPHLHFEIGGGIDPYGNPSQSRVGGRCTCIPAPPEASRMTGSCAPAGPTDDSERAAMTPSGNIVQPAGTPVTIEATLRNSGTTTWSTRYRLVRVDGPDFGAPDQFPVTASIAPRGSQSFRITATAPMLRAGVRATAHYQLVNASGTRFGARIPVIFQGPPSTDCRSSTLGREVPQGTCVQQGPTASPSCGWYRCDAGSWAASMEGCMPASTYENTMCTPVDPGSCELDGMRFPQGTCSRDGNDTMTPCAWHRCDMGSWIDTETSACDPDTTWDNAVCDLTEECRTAAQPCCTDSNCCDGLSCIVGVCQAAGGPQPGASCTTRAQCSEAVLECRRSTFGSTARECCAAGGFQCRADTDCCGEMTCEMDRCGGSSGTCRPRARGASCAQTGDCSGAMLCLAGTCGT